MGQDPQSPVSPPSGPPGLIHVNFRLSSYTGNKTWKDLVTRISMIVCRSIRLQVLP